MEELLSGNSCKRAIEKLLHALQNAGSNTEEFDHNLFADVIKTSSFFHKNLELPATVHDFAEQAKLHMNYEVIPPSTVISREGDILNNLSIVLKGTVIKFQPRRYDDIERELQAKRPPVPKATTEILDEDSSKKKEVPRYLQHTLATQKKTTLSKMGCYIMTLAKLEAETSDLGPKKVISEGQSKTMANVDEVRRYRRQRTKKVFNNSLNDLEMEENQTEQAGQEYEPDRPYLKRLVTIQPEDSPLKGDQDSLGELVQGDEEEVDENGEKKTKKKKKIKIEDPTMTPEEIAFLEALASAYPDITFFLADVVRVRKTKTYSQGDYFGDNFYREYRAKENSIIVTGQEEVHLLTFPREFYKSIMSNIYEHAEEKVQFFKEMLPSFDDETVRKFAYNFSEKKFKKNEYIYYENEKAQELYVLRSGHVKLLKTCDFLSNQQPSNAQTNPKKAEKGELAVASIMNKQFFGEEVLLKESRRLYTALVVTSDTNTYFLEADHYHGIKVSFVDLLKTLKKQTKEKFLWRQQRVLELVEQKKEMLTKLVAGQKLPENEKSPVAATVLMTSKTVKSMETAKITQLLDQPSNKQQETINQLRGMVLKTNRVLVVESPTKSNSKLDLYKAKFSRKAKIVDKANMEDKLHRIKGEEGVKTNPDIGFDGSDYLKFNIRKELTEKKYNKLKLPAISSIHISRDLIPAKGSETTRNLNIKDLDENFNIGSPIKQDYKQVKSSVFDNLDTEEAPVNHKARKLRLKDFTEMPSIVSPFLSPKAKMGEDKYDEQSVNMNDIINVHTLNLTKKSVSPNKWKKKLVSIARGQGISDFEGIVGKRSEYKVK